MSGHLKIHIGDVIQVLDEKPSAVDDGMWFGRVPGETPGIFPAKCVQANIPRPTAAAGG